MHCSWPQWLAITELYIVARRVAHTTVITYWVGFVSRRPNEATRRSGTFGDRIHFIAARAGKTKMAVIIGRQLTFVAAWHDDKDEALSLAGLGDPDNA